MPAAWLTLAGRNRSQGAAPEDEAVYAEPPPAAPPPPAQNADDAAGELERLASLHQSGALSDEEFAAAKQKVLGTSTRRPTTEEQSWSSTLASTLRQAIEIFISPSDENIANLDRLLTADATVWTPNMLATGLSDLQASLAFRESAFSDVDIHFDTLDVFGNRGLARIPRGRALLGTVRD